MAWLDVDTRCYSCNQVTKRAKGFNKQNVKRLLKPLPQNESEWTILICFLLIILIMFAYKQDTQVCREYAKQFESNWLNLSLNITPSVSPFVLNVSNLNLTFSNFTDG